MSTREYRNYVTLSDAMWNVVTSFYENYADDVTCQMAVNPDTFKVIAVESESEVPDGWIYEIIDGLTSGDIDDIAKKYFDFR